MMSKSDIKVINSGQFTLDLSPQVFSVNRFSRFLLSTLLKRLFVAFDESFAFYWSP